ncbi:MAG: hypothetical protein M3Z01_00525, partial [Thermoproteota archaeon]|nr:hypothetical protein [Thermoproteota archaeon]
MVAFYFPFWRRQYYFHPLAIDDKFLLSMYQPYKYLSKNAWFYWQKFKILQHYSKSELHQLPIQFKMLKNIVPNLNEYVWVINTGSA